MAELLLHLFLIVFTFYLAHSNKNLKCKVHNSEQSSNKPSKFYSTFKIHQATLKLLKSSYFMLLSEKKKKLSRINKLNKSPYCNLEQASKEESVKVAENSESFLQFTVRGVLLIVVCKPKNKQQKILFVLTQ